MAPTARQRGIMNRARHVHALECKAVDALNYLATGNQLLSSSLSSSDTHCSSSLPSSHVCGPSPPSIKQSYENSRPSLSSALSASVHAACSRFAKLSGSPAPVDVGTSLAKNSEFVLCERSGQLLASGFSYGKSRTEAQPLVASKVALPSEPASVELLSLLPAALREQWVNPGHAIHADWRSRGKQPYFFSVAEPREWSALLKRMIPLNMIHFQTERPLVINGAFGVPKDVDLQRLIGDMRPSNRAWFDPPNPDLPSPELISKLEVPPGHRAVFGKSDLSCFYHRLLTPAWCWTYFGMPSVKAAAVGLGHIFGPDTQIWPCFKVLVMGWSWAVYLAQVAHMHLVHTSAGFPPDSLLGAGTDLRLDRFRWLLYIDDLIFADIVALRCARYQAGYLACLPSGLPVKQGKVVLPSSSPMGALGYSVEGLTGTCGVAPTALLVLCTDTGAALLADDAWALESIVGRWTHACLVARPALSVLCDTYRFVEFLRKLRSRSVRVSIWSSVRAEFSVLIALAPLLFSKLDACWSPIVPAYDASSWGLGVCVTDLESHSASDIARFAGAGPDQLRSLIRSAFPATLPGSEGHSISILLPANVWRTVVSAPWRSPEHINLSEMRAALAALTHTWSRPSSFGCRVLMFGDSSTAVGTIAKGRSSRFGILRRSRPIAALSLAAVAKVYNVWVASADNTADGPSRELFSPGRLCSPGDQVVVSQGDEALSLVDDDAQGSVARE